MHGSSNMSTNTQDGRTCLSDRAGLNLCLWYIVGRSVEGTARVFDKDKQSLYAAPIIFASSWGITVSVMGSLMTNEGASIALTAGAISKALAIQQFMEMHKQEPLNYQQTILVEPLRQERREEDTTSSTQRVSNQGSHVSKTVSSQRSRSIHDQLYPRPMSNVKHCEDILSPPPYSTKTENHGQS
ncbi:hypothetical protein ACH5RR_029639 [Cinchona calisaya]|uniref:Uncharacterized protein n=1 Tax=Cinchona calisaya TaxID=153742 RepID=A0ABD2YSC2_9GENT